MSTSIDKMVAYNIITMEFNKEGSEPSNMDLNIALLIVLPIEFIFCYNCLRNVTWFGKSFPLQRCRLLNCSSTYNFAISDILSYRSIREFQSLLAISNISAPSPIILWILYIRSLFIQVFCTFHYLTVGSLHSQEVGSDVIITVVISGFVVGLFRLASLAGLVDVVSFFN